MNGLLGKRGKKKRTKAGAGSAGDAPGASAGEGSFISHLVELRDRLLRSILAILIGVLVLFPFARDLYAAFAGPLMELMPEGTSMIATQVTSPFLAPLKLVLLFSVILTAPYVIYQLWAFVAPGLYRHERRLAMPLLFSSIGLFYLGIAFAYGVVLPLVFRFILSVAPEGVSVMTDISQYLDFVFAVFIAFGIAFEVPIATLLLILSGVTTAEQLGRYRPYIIVTAFVVGMFLTPPDIVSQVLLALPMWLLFELGLLLSRWLPRTQSDAGAAASGERPMTEEEMDAELDRLDAESGERDDTRGSPDDSNR